MEFPLGGEIANDTAIYISDMVGDMITVDDLESFWRGGGSGGRVD